MNQAYELEQWVKGPVRGRLPGLSWVPWAKVGTGGKLTWTGWIRGHSVVALWSAWHRAHGGPMVGDIWVGEIRFGDAVLVKLWDDREWEHVYSRETH